MTSRVFWKSVLLIVFGGVVYWAVLEIREWEYRHREERANVAAPRPAPNLPDEVLAGNEIGSVDLSPSPLVQPSDAPKPKTKLQTKIKVIRNDDGDNVMDD